MNPLHLIWIIPLGLFCLIFLLLLFAVRVRIVYESTPEIWVGFGPGNIQVYPRPQKEKKQKKAKKEKSKEKKEKPTKEKKTSNFLPPFTPETIFNYLKMVMDTLGNLLRQIRIPELKLHLTVGNPDAAKTATTYGMVCAAAGTVLPRLEETCRIREMDVFIQPDFEEGKQKISLDITVSAIVLMLILCVLKLGVRFLRYRRAYFKAHPQKKNTKTKQNTDSKKGGSET